MRLTPALATGALVLLAAVPALAAPNEGFFEDTFDGGGYAGSTGTLALTAPWVEIGESDGPVAGDVRVAKSGKCSSGACLHVNGNEGGRRGAARTVDLSGATYASLQFSLAHSGAPGGTLGVSVSSDGGSTWRTVARYDRHDGKSTSRIDITDVARHRTVIAFWVSKGAAHTSYVDDVLIAVSYEDHPRPVPDPPDDGSGPPDHADPNGRPHATTTTTTGAPSPSSTTTTTVAPGPPGGSDGGGGDTTAPSSGPRRDALIGIAVQQRNFAPPAWTATAESLIRAGLSVTEISEGFSGAQALRNDVAPVTDVGAPLTRPAPGVRRGFVPTAIFGALLAWATITGFERRRTPEAAASS